ncbi:hypothetical protein MSAN_00913800 [Mycena sanguinolenta]|uniref:Uncharacterized protein n=1 Tax=Mycena sanguinolenta TaxID=230812 RepID=A0A8H7D8V7_9AGAR|nr:hypothetical protein MSAN_00913800 [Mycena sanguinolenta]
MSRTAPRADAEPRAAAYASARRPPSSEIRAQPSLCRLAINIAHQRPPDTRPTHRRWSAEERSGYTRPASEPGTTAPLLSKTQETGTLGTRAEWNRTRPRVGLPGAEEIRGN